MRFDERGLGRIFKAAILSVSAVHCDEDAVLPDASSADATAPAADASDAARDALVFTLPDSSYVCDAGAPTVASTCGACCTIMEEHCAIVDTDYADDAGGLYNCERYCPDSGVWGCAVAPSNLTPSDGGGVYVMCSCTGRRFAGYRARRAQSGVAGYFANMARLEGAAVFAFGRLHDELATLDAPVSLLARVRRSIADEERHARTIGRIAKRFGGRVAFTRAPRFRERSVERLAIENATEGCVRELYGALLATWQAEHAQDATARRAFRAIARDETGHAALSLCVARFVESKLEASARERVERSRRRAMGALREELACAPSGDLVRVAGVPNATQALALFDALFT